MRGKVMHVVLLVAAVPAAVWLGDDFGAALWIPFFAFWLGGVAEAFATPGVGTAEKIKGVGKATGATFLGLFIFVNLWRVFV